jgi:hypothetical protein
MKVDSEKLMWAAVAAGAAYVAGRLIDDAARRGWKSVTGAEPPAHPERSDTAWRDALIWTAATSLAAGMGRLLSQRIAAAGWQRLRGVAPPL